MERSSPPKSRSTTDQESPARVVRRLLTLRADKHEPAVNVAFEDLPLAHVRVAAAPAQRCHASLNGPQRLARRYAIAFFGFLDRPATVLRHGGDTADSPAQREAIRLYRR